MFRSDPDALPTDSQLPGGWGAPGHGGPDGAPWPARGGFFTGGSGGPVRPGDHPGPGALRSGGDGVDAARLDEEDDFEEDFLDDDEDDDEGDDLFDDEEVDDDDDLLDEEDDEAFDFEDD